MNGNDQEKREEAVFEQAAQMASDEERAAYLDQACGGDAELRTRLELLLEGHFKGEGFLDRASTRDAGVGGTLRVNQPGEEEIGVVIDRYKLMEKIGEGGFGVVYVAEQREPVKRRVALKIIKLGMDTKQVIARFEAERQALALMDHPNIARVLDAGATETGRPYFVMELVRGTRITDYCDENNLSTAQRLDLFRQVCHAIQHAHQKGIIHRDIKPSNILVTVVDGRPVPKVIDFGIAKATHGQLTEQTVYTQLHQFIGTPAYMSPEQAQLSGVDVDTRSDIYSLGVLLYELLTGHTPFDPKTLLAAGLDEMRRMIREKEPPRPSTRISTLEEAERTTVAKHRQAEPATLSRLVRGDLDWIVMKCLEKERGRRYDTANALALDIDHHLAQEPVTAAAPAALYRAGKFVRRHKAGLATATTSLLVLAAGAVVSTWQAVRATRAEHTQSQLRQSAEAEKERADAHGKQVVKEKEAARFNLYVAQISLAQRELEDQNFGLALNLLEEQRPEKGQEDLRGFEWYYLWRQCNRGLLATLRGHEDGVEALAFLPDGATLVSASGDGIVRSWPLKSDSTPEVLGRLRSGVRCAVFSHDGKMLAWGGTNGTIVVWDVSRCAERVNIQAHNGSVRGLAFSPDSRALASGGQDQMVRVWDVSTGKAVGPGWEIVLPRGSLAPPHALAFSPDSQLLAVNNYGAIQVYELSTGQLRQKLPAHRFFIRFLAFLPDGKSLVSGNGGEMKFWDLATGQEKTALARQGGRALSVSPDGSRLALGQEDGSVEVYHLSSGRTNWYAQSKEVHALAFSPDGNWLATGSLDRTIKLWDLRSPADPPPIQREWHKVWSVAFSPDGRQLVYSREGSPWTILDAATGQEVTVLSTPWPLSAVYSADGKMLAVSGDGNVELWDAATWQQRAVFNGHTGYVGAVSFSPDGKTLASASWGGSVWLWDIASGRTLARIEGQHTAPISFCLAFSPDGTRLASASGEYSKSGSAVLWDVATDRKVATLPLGSTSVAFSPGGKTLASGLLGGSIGLWDPATGRKTGEMSGHVKFSRDLAFFPGGKILATCNNEGSITLWDLVRGQQRATLRKRDRPVQTLAVAPDGRAIAAATEEGRVELWRAADEGEVTARRPDPERLCELAGEISWQGVSLQERGQDGRALMAYGDAVTLYQSTAKQFPGPNHYRSSLDLVTRRWFKLLIESAKTGAQECSRAVSIADEAIALAERETNALPDKVALCCDKAKLLEKAGQPEEALATFSKAVEWGSANPRRCSSVLFEARLGHAGLLQRMNRLAEASAELSQILKIPRRDAWAGTSFVDLSPFYTENLGRFKKQNQGSSPTGLPSGIRTLAGTEFDIRGLVQLPRRPGSVAGIPIHRKCSRLQVLHGVSWGGPDGTKIGSYILRYADGQQAELPIRLGEDARDWWSDGMDATRATIAWTGPRPDNPKESVRLFKRTWDNPRPEVEVESIDFTSTTTQCAPFLVALTVE
jgi:eukaryotic-like serine/threonine-protein kinase